MSYQAGYNFWWCEGFEVTWSLFSFNLVARTLIALVTKLGWSCVFYLYVSIWAALLLHYVSIPNMTLYSGAQTIFVSLFPFLTSPLPSFYYSSLESQEGGLDETQCRTNMALELLGWELSMSSSSECGQMQINVQSFCVYSCSLAYQKCHERKLGFGMEILPFGEKRY